MKELNELSQASSKTIKDKIISRLRRKVLPSKAMIEMLPAKAKLETERQIMPHSGFGRWLIVVVREFEKHVLHI